MSQVKMEATWKLFLEQFIAVPKVELPARLGGAGWAPQPGACASGFTACGAACCLQQLWQLAGNCQSCFAPCFILQVMRQWCGRTGGWVGTSWSLFSPSGSQGKNGTVQSNVHRPHQSRPACMLLPLLGWEGSTESDAEESNKVALQQLAVSSKSVPKAVQILPYALPDLSLWFFQFSLKIVIKLW